MPVITLFRRGAATLPLLLAAILLASLFTAVPPADASTAADRRQDRIGTGFEIVKRQLGDRYQYGAAGPDRFDCSGLIYYSFRKAGFSGVPRTSGDQARHMNRIKRAQMRRGDFVFFHNGGNVYHVGVFAGWRDGRRTIISAPNSDSRVRRDSLWTNSWFPGTLRGL